MGTPGHMAHPFDVESVQTGQDLIDYINNAVSQLAAGEIAGSVKWDGINTSFKLVTDRDGEKDFRMDRGTNHTDSVIGLTAAGAYKKWPEGHGMPPAIEKLLTIFNNALPSIESELKKLGMWDDPTKYFNTEYIEGTSNVQEYGANILAIHGINQFYEKKAQPHAIRKGTSMDRPGAPRPLDSDGKPIKTGGIEIPYNHTALENLIRKVQPYAEQYGFEIFGDVPVEFDEEVELDLEKILEIPIEIQIEPGKVKRSTLREWLHMVEHPKDKKITKVIRDQSGNPVGTKDVGALSKDIYMAVLRSATEEGVALSEYLQDPNDINDAINGGIFYHATRLLGQAVKEALTSQAGSLGRHEGVVLRGMEDFLVKLTGDFIVQGLQSTHGQHVTENLKQLFTVTISKDVKLTKTISEWLKEARTNNHTFEKLPTMVYGDIMAGIPIVDIVAQENAQKAIYNAALGFASSLLSEDEEDFVGYSHKPVNEEDDWDAAADDWYELRHQMDQELGQPIDDETADPVVDADYTGETIAFVPGAYKPPHLGHLKMVEQYANRDDVDRVIVLISSPKKKNRTLDDGTVITARHAEDVWKLLLTSAGLSANPKIDLRISKEPSPIGATLDMIGEDGILKSGDKVILGASDKPVDEESDIPDWHRWLFVQPKDVKSGVEVLDLESNAVKAFNRQGGTEDKAPKPFRATDMRTLISKARTDISAVEELEEFVGEENVFELLAIFGMGPRQKDVEAELEEGSTSGAVGGYGANAFGDQSKFNQDQDEDSRLHTVTTENIDLNMVDEVMKLIIEKGILR